MSKDAYTKFDFGNAGTTDIVVRTLKTWLQKSEDKFADSWEAVANSAAQLQCDTVLSRSFDEGIRSVNNHGVGYPIFLSADKVPSFACISNKDVITLVATIVGNADEEQDFDRKLTSIEISLCSLLFETFASALSVAFTGADVLSIEVGECDEVPQLSKLIPVRESVLCTKLQIIVAEKPLDVTWMLPRKETEKLFESATGLSLSRAENNPKQLVMTLPLDLVGVLGCVDMKMSKIANLKSGDIVKLDQKIDEPLAVVIDDKELFRCWPGRVGKQQGLEIVSVS